MKTSHRKKYLCSNCLYSGKAGGNGLTAPESCPSCAARDCCRTVWYRLRFPSKDASKTRWKQALQAMGWIERERAKETTEYGQWIAKVVKRVTNK